MDAFATAKQFFLEGLKLLEANHLQAAEIQFAQSLALLPDRVSTLNNLAAIKLKRKQFAEAEQFARKAIAVEANSTEAWSNLGIALTALDRPAEALPACDRALESQPACTRLWLTKAMTLLKLKRFDEALQACDQALVLDASQDEILYTKSLILKELNRPDEAQEIHRKSLELRFGLSPVFIAERRATQKADVLIINPKPEDDGSLTSFENLHIRCPNFPGQVAERFQEEFHFTYVLAGVVTNRLAWKQIPQPDFVINNHANGEVVLAEGDLPALTELADRFGVPVVNHPAKVIQSTRDVSVKLLEAIPGVLVPKTTRFSSAGKTGDALLHEIEAQYDYPLITRTLTSQMGRGMTKVDSRAALAEVLAAGLQEQFFVTQFVDSRGGDEFFRKIRAAVVKDAIVIVRVDYDTFWNVHGRKSQKRVPFYLERVYLLDEEKRICHDPEAGLGRPAMQSLRALRERIPLDVFGIDFEVDAEGRVVFYEANATMNLFSTARKEVPNPKVAEDALKQAFQRYLTSLVSAPSAIRSATPSPLWLSSKTRPSA